MTATASALGVDRGPPAVLHGARLALHPLTREHITARYLAWTGDDEVNRHSRRFGKPAQDATEVAAWLAGLQRDEIALAIEAPPMGHIGNIKYGPINWSNLDADVSILIGERAAWGRGYGAEAHYVVVKHLFFDRGLNRVHAASINPAYVRMVERLGWAREGVQREESRVGGVFHDSILLSFLRRDFVVMPEYEPAR
ncbi:MAG: GNAT family N-acetyltransferase [Alphaproteobacteria bacterium]|nr:GNAT family N-acetyltransferase [Alphaproteobacteria bacterium]